mmetsp:Transcript_94083/g.255469  ORF Transcript_94083/g.255469 Transcript_94083/m.255469 type:complete len:229 (-) Transcript_94083:124-810(-)
MGREGPKQVELGYGPRGAAQGRTLLAELGQREPHQPRRRRGNPERVDAGRVRDGIRGRPCAERLRDRVQELEDRRRRVIGAESCAVPCAQWLDEVPLRDLCGSEEQDRAEEGTEGSRAAQRARREEEGAAPLGARAVPPPPHQRGRRGGGQSKEGGERDPSGAARQAHARPPGREGAGRSCAGGGRRTRGLGGQGHRQGRREDPQPRGGERGPPAVPASQRGRRGWRR